MEDINKGCNWSQRVKIEEDICLQEVKTGVEEHVITLLVLFKLRTYFLMGSFRCELQIYRLGGKVPLLLSSSITSSREMGTGK
ncbi:hypothetical protein QQP08_013442, partial [Theobroma cacao]